LPRSNSQAQLGPAPSACATVHTGAAGIGEQQCTPLYRLTLSSCRRVLMTSMGWHAHASARPPIEPAQAHCVVITSDSVLSYTVRSSSNEAGQANVAPVLAQQGRTSNAFHGRVDGSDLLGLLFLSSVGRAHIGAALLSPVSAQALCPGTGAARGSGSQAAQAAALLLLMQALQTYCREQTGKCTDLKTALLQVHARKRQAVCRRLLKTDCEKLCLFVF